jgi:predicted DNA-binding transcriptional regulator AlpA
MSRQSLGIYLRYKDLEERGIVQSRHQMALLQRKYGFPRPIRLNPKSSIFDEQEILDWIERRRRETGAAA